MLRPIQLGHLPPAEGSVWSRDIFPLFELKHAPIEIESAPVHRRQDDTDERKCGADHEGQDSANHCAWRLI